MDLIFKLMIAKDMGQITTEEPLKKFEAIA
jgi:hypothetical protein